MSLLEMFRGVREKQAVNKAELWGQYRQLLLRRNDPKRGDGEKLTELCEGLGLTEAHVRLHVWLLDQADRLQATVEGAKTANTELAAIEKQGAPLQAKITQLQGELDVLRLRAAEVQNRATVAARDGGTLERLRGRLPALLTGDITRPTMLGGDLDLPGMTELLASLGLKSQLDGMLMPDMTPADRERLHRVVWQSDGHGDGRIPSDGEFQAGAWVAPVRA